MNKLENPAPGNTPLCPEEILGLKLKSISTHAELNRWEQENIQDAIDWLERRRKSEILDQRFICQLHAKMYSKVWTWAGSFRRTEKNIGVAWILIPQKLKQLLDDVQFWVENETYSSDEIAYRFHHQLVLIHLFPNGNGRHARLITDTLLVEKFHLPPFSWGGGNITDGNSVRANYIKALKAADDHDYSLLKSFVRS
jgi:Fic-DOC domain mobile mystery protein B